MSKSKNKSAPRNPVKVAMDLRFGKTTTSHRHKNDRRSKDNRKSWQNEEY